MRVSNPVGRPFEFLTFLKPSSNEEQTDQVESVLLPTFVECVYLSPEVRGVKPGPIRNWTQAELLRLQRINK